MRVTFFDDIVASVTTSPTEPLFYQDAISNPAWIKTMEEEIASIHANRTWSLLDLPPGHHPISVKWIYRLKTGSPGSAPKYKARLVARGDQQGAGIDYQETFAPVVKWSTMRTLVSLAAQHGWPVHHMDVKSAFLHDLLDDTVFIKQPPGFIQPGSEHKVCRLHKALYGLRQSPRAWNDRINDYLQSLGIVQCCADPSTSRMRG
jgi:hypothetical protein